MKNHYKISDYAKLIGKSRQSVYKKVNNGVYRTVNLDNVTYIIDESFNNNDPDKKVKTETDNLSTTADNQTDNLSTTAVNQTDNRSTNNEIDAKVTALVKNDKDLLKEIELLRKQHQEIYEREGKKHLIQLIIMILAALTVIACLLFYFMDQRNSDKQTSLEREKALRSDFEGQKIQFKEETDRIIKEKDEYKQESKDLSSQLFEKNNEIFKKSEDLIRVKFENSNLLKKTTILEKEKDEISSKNKDLEKKIIELEEKIKASANID